MCDVFSTRMNLIPRTATLPKRLLAFGAALLLCAAQFLFLVPAAIFTGNPDEFSFNLPSLLVHGLPWLGICAAATVLLSIVLPNRALRSCVVVLICFGLALYLQSAILIWDYGQLDGSDIAWDKHRLHGIVDLAVWFCVFLCGLMFRRWIFDRAWRICGFVLTLEILTLTPAFFSTARNTPAPVSDAQYAHLFEFSSSKNAIVIVLDSLQSPVFSELLKRDPTLAQEFRDFTYLPNTTSSFPSTLPSIPSLLSGVAYDSSTPLYEYFEEVVAKKSLPAVLRQQGYQVSLATLPGFCRFFESGECAEARRYPAGGADDRSRQEYIELLDYALFRSVPHHLKKSVYNDDRWVLRDIIRDEAAQRTRSDGSLNLVSRFEDEAKVSAEKPTFKFIHLLLPHPPLRVDAQCRILTRGSKLTNEGYLEQARCALRAATRLIEKFKLLGVYDQSMIVVTADHGLRLDYGTNDPAYSKPRGLLQVSRALPVLLIKPFSQRGELRRSNAPAQLIDVPKTLAVALRASENLPGSDLQTVAENADRERFFTDLSLRWAFWKETRATDPGASAPRFSVRGNAWNPHDWHKVQ